MSIATILHARLNRSGTYVVCGLQSCGTRIALVGHPTAEDIAEFKERGESALPCIQFLSGWAPRRDNVWVFSRYAKLRKRWGRSVKTRRYPKENGAVTGNDVMNSLYDALPVRAKCSECGFVNVLTTTDLGIPRIIRVPAEHKYV